MIWGCGRGGGLRGGHWRTTGLWGRRSEGVDLGDPAAMMDDISCD